MALVFGGCKYASWWQVWRWLRRECWWWFSANMDAGDNNQNRHNRSIMFMVKFVYSNNLSIIIFVSLQFHVRKVNLHIFLLTPCFQKLQGPLTSSVTDGNVKPQKGHTHMYIHQRSKWKYICHPYLWDTKLNKVVFSELLFLKIPAWKWLSFTFPALHIYLT